MKITYFTIENITMLVRMVFIIIAFDIENITINIEV
jgi:hypothetical protein